MTRREFHRGLLCLLISFVGVGSRDGRADVPLPDLPFDRTQLVDHYDLDFRESRYDFQAIRVEGSGVQVSLVKPTKAGLTVQVPPRTDGTYVGLCTKFGIRGDFEVIVAYEVTKAPLPESGPGIGPEVYLQSAAHWDNHIALTRRVAPGTGNPSFTAAIERATTPGRIEGTLVSSTAEQGRFYLARAGSTVSLYAAEGGGGYQKVLETEFGTDDLLFARLATFFEGADRGLTVVWKDLTIRANSLPRTLADASNRGWPWAWIIAGGCVALVLGAGGVIAWSRRARSA